MRKEGYIAIGFAVMCFNSLYQYSWNALETLFSSGLRTGLVEVSVAFSLFTVSSTLAQTVGGYIADRRGPVGVGVVSSILSALGFLGTSFSSSLITFYTFWTLGSAGEGILYGLSANMAVKWFPERRGLATGLVSLGFGLGAALANPWIEGYSDFREPTMLIGLTELAVLPILLYLSRYPGRIQEGKTPRQALSTLRWWLIYFSFVTSTVPLNVMSSSLTVISEGEVSKGVIEIMLSVFPLLSGISRPVLGFFSDIFGRARTVALVDTAVLMGSLLESSGEIVPAAIIIGFFGGSAITLYFSIVGDIFGAKFATANNGILYTGKAITGILSGVIFAYVFTLDKHLSGLFLIANSIIGIVLLISAVYSSKRYVVAGSKPTS